MLPNSAQWKQATIRFARSLQMLFKSATMFSATHPSVQTALSNTFEQLNALVKENGQFTIGFVDGRVLLNSLLTSEKSLSGLETEFLKRGIGAVSFEAGITSAAYRRAISVIVSAPNLEDSDTNSIAHLGNNPLDFVRIHPAPKGQRRTDSGDTILEMDSESFLMSKAFEDIRTPGLERIDSLFKSAGFLSGAGEGSGIGLSSHGNGGGFGSGPSCDSNYSGEPQSDENDAMGTTIHAGQKESQSAPGHGGANGSSPGGPAGISAMVESYFCSSLAEGDSAPQRSYVELARLIQETRPEFVLAAFPPQRREELRKLPLEQMAQEVIEDSAVKWAAERLVGAPTGPEAVIVEQEVIRVLIRTLQTTQTAGRLATKLAQYLQDFKIPQSTHMRIREELEWTAVPSDEKTRRLLAIDSYNSAQFRRLAQHLSDLSKAGKHEPASALAERFFETVTRGDVPMVEELGRIPEFVQSCGTLKPEIWKAAVDRLLVKLTAALDQVRHLQIVNGLHAISQVLARYEAFEVVNEIGAALEGMIANSDKHDSCCKAALGSLVTTHVLDRILEIYLQKKDDNEIARLAPAMLRRSGRAGISKVFLLLESEASATGRIGILRLITKIGAPALELATERLKDERWYVVRNSCKLLSDLRDPNILAHVGPLLMHADERVQKAAAAGIIDSRLPGRAVVLAKHLGYLHGSLVEDAATELIFLHTHECVAPLLAVFTHEPKNSVAELAAVQILATMPGEDSGAALLNVVLNGNADFAARRVALKSLLRATGPKFSRELQDFAELHSADTLSGDVKAALAAVGANS